MSGLSMPVREEHVVHWDQTNVTMWGLLLVFIVLATAVLLAVAMRTVVNERDVAIVAQEEALHDLALSEQSERDLRQRVDGLTTESASLRAELEKKNLEVARLNAIDEQFQLTVIPRSAP